MYILLIEDNADLATNVGEYLEEHGHIIDYAQDGVTGLHLATVNGYDIIVLDLQLPGIDGLTLCQRLRGDARSQVPILMLTARDTVQNKLEGFAAGADDYLTKPFSLAELLARMKSLVRRAEGTSDWLQVADLSLDLKTLILRRGQQRLKLTPTGLRLLELLMRASPSVVSRAAVERTIWVDDPPDNDASLRGHIHNLRVVIDAPFDRKLLKTIHGIGYRLAPDDAL